MTKRNNKFRELSPEERQATVRAIRKMEDELDYQRYLQQDADLLLVVGLKQRYLLKMSEYRLKKRDAAKTITTLTVDLARLKDHLIRGVPPKDY